MARVVVVGAGIVGTMHAQLALSAGHDVVQLDREPAARGASVRNFGLVWVSGRAAGDELALALRARELWQEIGAAVPGVGFRANGSLTVARDDTEDKLLAEAAALPDAEARGFRHLDAAEVRRHNPALAGVVAGGLLCSRDAAVEPRWAAAALVAQLQRSPRYRFEPGREVVEVSDHAVRDSRGEVHAGDLVVLATGAWHNGLLADVLTGAALRRVRLQMMQTAPWSTAVPTSLADADSLRYYPAFCDLPLHQLAPQSDIADRWRMQLLLVQRLDGSLTIGDTHAYDEPFDIDVDEAPYDHLRHRAEELLGVPPPRTARRWAGVYSQVTDDRLYHHSTVTAGVEVVTGLGGRGMTCAPAVAEQTLQRAGLVA